MKKSHRTYAIFYLKNKYYQGINHKLEELGLSPKIKAIIPTLNILKRNSRGKMLFENVPILFNYGFMKMPVELAYSRTFLNTLRKKIPGIRSWLKDTETIFSRKKRKRIDNAEDWDDFSKVATVKRDVVRRFIKLAKANKQYSVEELMSLKIGDYITLNNYPYEGVDATVLSIDYNAKMVEVVMYPEYGKLITKLPFDDIFYTIYRDYNPDILIGQDKPFNPNTYTQDYLDRQKLIKRKKGKT